MRISDWSSDVCSSDLPRRRCRGTAPGDRRRTGGGSPYRARGAYADADRRPWRCGEWTPPSPDLRLDRKSVVSGKSVSVRVDLGGRRIIKKHTKTSTSTTGCNIVINSNKITINL